MAQALQVRIGFVRRGGQQTARAGGEQKELNRLFAAYGVGRSCIPAIPPSA
jgi:hypothetical protein